MQLVKLGAAKSLISFPLRPPGGGVMADVKQECVLRQTAERSSASNAVAVSGRAGYIPSLFCTVHNH